MSESSDDEIQGLRAATIEDMLRERRDLLLSRIDEALQTHGRSADDVRVMAVSKTVDAQTVACAYRVGYRLFGENRPQELRHKTQALADLVLAQKISFHMIGNLQSNKINMVLGHADLIHSVSSYALAQKISEHACARSVVQDVLLEANVSGEASKSGFSKDELLLHLDELAGLKGIRLVGLMTMAPAGSRARARSCFEALRLLRDECEARTGLSLSELSCGMSGDFEEAIAEGSTLIRLGRIVFDPHYPLAMA